MNKEKIIKKLEKEGYKVEKLGDYALHVKTKNAIQNILINEKENYKQFKERIKI